MKGSSDFRSKMDIVHPSVKPVVLILSDLRTMLASRYTKAEKNAALIDHTCADGLHEKFIRAFTLISQAKKLQGIELFPFDHEPKEPARSKPSEKKQPDYNPPSCNLPTKRPLSHATDAEHSGNANKNPHETAKATDYCDENPRSTKRLKQHAAVSTPAHRYNLRPRRNRG